VIEGREQIIILDGVRENIIPHLAEKNLQKKYGILLKTYMRLKTKQENGPL